MRRIIAEDPDWLVKILVIFLRVVQYSDKCMHGIVLYYIHLTVDKQYNTIQYNIERSNTIEWNTIINGMHKFVGTLDNTDLFCNSIIKI